MTPKQTPPSIDLSVCIVSFNVKNHLKNCLHSIFDQDHELSLEVLVVDNDSQDHSVTMIKKDFPKAQVFAQEKNLGFAKGVNICLQKAQGQYCLLLNPDTKVCQDSLKHLLDYLKNTPACAIVGPQLINSNGSIQNGLRQFPSAISALYAFTFLKKLPPCKKLIKRYRMREIDLHQDHVVNQVSGAAMLFHRSLLDEIGLLDEQFYIFFEEVDFCKRAFDRGHEIHYFSKAKIIHTGGESIKKVNKDIMYIRLESQIKYLRKYMRPSRYLPFMLLFKTLYLFTILLECFFDLFLKIYQKLLKSFFPKPFHSQKWQKRQNKSEFRWFFLQKKIINFLSL